jgi:hypothetical protein
MSKAASKIFAPSRLRVRSFFLISLLFLLSFYENNGTAKEAQEQRSGDSLRHNQTKRCNPLLLTPALDCFVASLLATKER